MAKTLPDEIHKWITKKETTAVITHSRGMERMLRAIALLGSPDRVLVRARMSRDALGALEGVYHHLWVVSRLHVMTLQTVTMVYDEAEWFIASGFNLEVFKRIHQTHGVIGVTDDLLEAVLTEQVGVCIPHKRPSQGYTEMLAVPTMAVSTTYGLDWEVFDWMRPRRSSVPDQG